MHFSQLKSIHYLVLALNSLHTFTWASSSILSSTGHGIPMDFSATTIATLSLFSDIGAIIAQGYTPYTIGLYFRRVSTVFTRVFVVLSAVTIVVQFLMKEFGGRHSALVIDYLLKQKVSVVETERISRIHLYTLYKKRAIRFLLAFEILVFPLAFFVYFIQFLFFGSGYVTLLFANLPCGMLWLFTFASIGSPGANPPDGSSDIAELVAVGFAHFVGAISAAIILFVASFLPSSLAGPPPFLPYVTNVFWQISASITGVSIGVLFGVSVLIFSIVKTRFDEQKLLKAREDAISQFKKNWAEEKLYKRRSSSREKIAK